MPRGLATPSGSDPAITGSRDGISVAQKGRLRRMRKLFLLLRRPAWRRAARKGVAATVEHRAVPFGKSFATIIDVGAHHGQFALLAREMYPEAEVICVEPLPDAVARLRTVHEADDRVTILPFALAAGESLRSMHASRKTDSSSLLPILKPYVGVLFLVMIVGVQFLATYEVTFIGLLVALGLLCIKAARFPRAQAHRPAHLEMGSP